MVKALTYDNPDHKIKLKIRQFQVTGKSKRQVNNQISKIYLKSSESYEEKIEGVPKDPAWTEQS